MYSDIAGWWAPTLHQLLWYYVLIILSCDAGDYETRYLFELAIAETSAPAITQAITAMFTDPASPWFPLIKRDNRQSFHAAKLMETPLLNVSGFRDQLLAGLSDKSVVGTLRPRPAHPVDELDLTPENTYGLLLARGSNISSTVIKVSAEDRNVARPLHEMKFRVCDVIAWELSGIELPSLRSIGQNQHAMLLSKPT